jgi:hypothetical protein
MQKIIQKLLFHTKSSFEVLWLIDLGDLLPNKFVGKEVVNQEPSVSCYFVKTFIRKNYLGNISKLTWLFKLNSTVLIYSKFHGICMVVSHKIKKQLIKPIPLIFHLGFPIYVRYLRNWR